MAEATGAVTDAEVKNPDSIMAALQQQANISLGQYETLAKKLNSLGEEDMAEVMTPGMIMGMGGNGGDGLFGGGGGLVGGLILGSLLRQGNGGLFGGNGGDGAGAAGALLRSPPEQVTANMQLMQAVGAVDKSVAVNAATFEASQATQSLGITTQLASVASSLTNNLNQVNTNVMQGNALVNQNIMENRYELSKDISSDGEKTRALLIAQYEATLNRQLGDANAEIIALRNRAALDAATNGITLTNTNNINQMQQQSQQQQQYGQLANMIWGLGQQIRSTNEAINVGSGTLTANPANTNTNIR